MDIYHGTFVRIPSCVMNKKMPNDEKILYGLILYWSYYEAYDHTIKEMCEEVNCCASSIRKYMKDLEKRNLIKIEVYNQYRRVITPLEIDGVHIITEDNNIKDEREKFLRQQRANKYITPEFVKNFISDIL